MQTFNTILLTMLTSDIASKLARIISIPMYSGRPEISTKYVKNSAYDQEIPQSQTTDNHMAPRGRATQLSRDIRKKK